NWLQVYGADRLEENPNNTRAIIRDFGRERGIIATADGVVVARSLEVDDDLERERQYPEGDLYGHVTGHFAFNLGATGVEDTYNDLLAGQTDQQKYGDLGALLTGEDTTGNLTLTIRDDVQRVARDALGERKGSVVVVDPRDGSIIAMWSFPSYDPNTLSTVDLAAADAAWQRLRAEDPASPDLPKTYRRSFPPGSTFKVVTASAGLGSDIVTPSDPVLPPSSGYTAPLTTSTIGNFGGSTCGGDLANALRVSCNTFFAELGAEILGPEPLIGQADAFGFNARPPIDLPAAEASTFPTDFGAVVGETDGDPPVPIVENTPGLAQASIGQNDVAATPLQMALVAAAVANNGVVMTPHVMQEVRNRSGELVEQYDESAWRVALRPSDAATMRRLMLDVAASGTATGLQVPGFEVGGKTGTAQTIAASDDTHAWIIGFAGPPGDAPTVAVAVIVEAEPGRGQQTGGTVAAPIAQQVLAAALQPLPSAPANVDDLPADD
ncbi:MAG: penicillin-binding protein 2, partial [Acidimicrobiia bacterium]|nr:penicillin-binding protein 2 [Acidimicrobiia bacterium]